MGSAVCWRANMNGPGAWWLGCWIYKLHILHIEGLKGSYESFRITIQWSSRVHSMIVSPHRGTNIPARYGHEKAPVGSSVNLAFWGSTQTLFPQFFFGGGSEVCPAFDISWEYLYPFSQLPETTTANGKAFRGAANANASSPSEKVFKRQWKRERLEVLENFMTLRTHWLWRLWKGDLRFVLNFWMNWSLMILEFQNC